MAIAAAQEWVVEDRSTANYDAIDERLKADGVPDGLIVHCAGFAGKTFRIFDMWESSEHYGRPLPLGAPPARDRGGRPGRRSAARPQDLRAAQRDHAVDPQSSPARASVVRASVRWWIVPTCSDRL
jgi:hypothetical protein